MRCAADVGRSRPAGLQSELVERAQREIGEDADAVAQHPIGLGEGQATLRLRPLGGGGVWNAPMGGHRLARPDRAHFIRRVVADGEDEIHHRRARCRKLVPALGAQGGGRVVHLAQQIERIGMNLALRMAAGAEALEAAGALAVEDAFRKDAARGISGAQEQHVINMIRHGASPPDDLKLWTAGWDGRRDQLVAALRLATAAILDEELEQRPRPVKVGAVQDGPPLPLR
jgi:hypothetical protein